MATMMSKPPQHQIGSGGDGIIATLSANAAMPVMESRKKIGAYGKRKKDCGGNNTPDTPTVTETKKKRPYKRKNCGGDTPTDTSTSVMKKRKDSGGDTSNMSTVTEMKKERAYGKRKDGGDASTSVVKKRKDCGGHTTETSLLTETKKKRAYKRKGCGGDTAETSTSVVKKQKDCGGGDTTSTATITEIKKKRQYRRKKPLPHDLIFEEILTRLPVPTLLTSVLVSKQWYDSIHNDHKRLTYKHFLQSQKQPEVVLSLLNVRDGFVEQTGEPSYACHLFKFTAGSMYWHIENVLQFQHLRGGIADRDFLELVGYCNGLPCMAIVRKYSTAYIILDPNRGDFLYIFYPARVGRGISKTRIICHGFGFDPSANEYKLVSIYQTPQKELNILVFTLGTKSWRNVTPTSMPISDHDGRPIISIRVPTGSDKSAIFCATSSSNRSSGCLAWKVIATLWGAGSNDMQHDNSNAVNTEMEMLLSFNVHDEKFQFSQLPAKSTTDEQQKHLLVDYPHLLVFKGSPCIARIEKISGNGSDHPHRCREDHQGSSSCCCCCKVHLYILKDNVKQVWVKEESFDVRINSTPRWLTNVGYIAPDPCCFCFGSSTTPPTRILSFSDQMLLYWFNGKYLQVYNLRSEKLQLVLPVNTREKVIFEAKMKEPRHIFNSGDDNDTHCSSMDYQLHCHEENFLSLQTFIPEGVKGVGADNFSVSDTMRGDRRCSAYMLIYRGSTVYYPFF